MDYNKKAKNILENLRFAPDNLCDLLHYAALCGAVEMVKVLIDDYGYSVDCRNQQEQTALHVACNSGQLEVVRMLVSQYNADVNACDEDDDNPLSKAALNGHVDVVKCMIDEFSCNPNIKGLEGRTILHQACNSGNFELVEKLITQYGLDPLSVNDYGSTPLHIAALAGSEQIAQLLITKYKCPVDIRNKRKQTPLHYACREGHLKVVRMLVSQYNADTNTRDEQNHTPLNEGVLNGHADAVKCMIDELSCSPNIEGFKGQTILHQACNSGNIELVEMLITQYSLDPLSVNDNGDTPLHIAALAGREQIAQLLITKYKCPVDIRNKRKQTPLHYACHEGHIKVVRMLAFQFNADVNARDEDDDTPLNKAALNGHADVVKCMIDEFECSPHTKGYDRRSLLHQACFKGHDLLVKLLIDQYHVSLLSADNAGDTPLHISAIFGQSRCFHSLLHNYNAPIFLRNNKGKTAVDEAINEIIRKIALDYLKVQHRRILYEYKEVQALSSKKYSGAQKLTRVFVVGNVESGKSTLIESLRRENFFSSFNPVSEASVLPHTSGIVPSVHYSKAIGRVLYYDFAGDPEYYSSHSAIVSNVIKSKYGTNIFLVVTNLTKDIVTMQDELGYWFSFISYNMANLSQHCIVVVIGSHSDLISSKERSEKLELMKSFEFSLNDTFQVEDYLLINCRKPRSSKRLLKAIDKTLQLAPEYSLSEEAAILLGLLEKDFNNVVTCKLSTLVIHIKDTGIHLPNTGESLYPFVQELHSLGLLMTIKKKVGKLEDCLLLLGISKLTNEVHKVLFSHSTNQERGKTVHGASMGILPHTYLKEKLPDYVSIECLLQLQYCQEFGHAEVKFDYTVVPIEDPSAPRLLYFPALCTAERNDNIKTPEDYSYNIGWFAECQSKFDYFPSRFLHVLLLRLAFSFAHPVAPCETEGQSGPHVDVIKSNCGCTMWKNGIHWHMEEGVECIVELVNNSKGLVAITKSTIEHKRKKKCAEILFKIIDLAIQAT